MGLAVLFGRAPEGMRTDPTLCVQEEACVAHSAPFVRVTHRKNPRQAFATLHREYIVPGVPRKEALLRVKIYI